MGRSLSKARGEALLRYLQAARRGVAASSTFLGNHRSVFLPLGLVALLACGVHAGAEVLSDRILGCVDRLDAVFDGLFSRFSWTRSWVNVVGPGQRLWVARGLALLWELAVDVVLVAPLLRSHGTNAEASSGRELLRACREVLGRTASQPTSLRIVRPLATVGITLAGAYAVAHGLETSFFQLTHHVLGFGPAASLGALLQIAVSVGILYALGGLAVLRSAEHADALSLRRRRHFWDFDFTRGAWASLLVAPLAVAALFGATPLLSVFGA